jgi:hypothetical protein
MNLEIEARESWDTDIVMRDRCTMRREEKLASSFFHDYVITPPDLFGASPRAAIPTSASSRHISLLDQSRGITTNMFPLAAGVPRRLDGHRLLLFSIITWR